MNGQDLPEFARPKLASHEAITAVEAWNLMDGKLDWNALDFIADLLGVSDPEVFVRQLVAIRNAMNDKES